jgi:quinol monooxygenase YgiN
MIKIVAKTKFKAECLDEVKALVEELVKKSRMEEGNIRDVQPSDHDPDQEQDRERQS